LFYLENNAESNAVLHDTTVCSNIFIYSTRTSVQYFLVEQIVNILDWNSMERMVMEIFR